LVHIAGQPGSVAFHTKLIALHSFVLALIFVAVGATFVQVHVGLAEITLLHASFAYTVLAVGHDGSFCVHPEQLTVDDHAK
jgi:uncharacterized membrane protein